MSRIIKNIQTVDSSVRHAKVISVRNMALSNQKGKEAEPAESPISSHSAALEKEMILEEARIEAESILTSAEAEVQSFKNSISDMRIQWEKEKEVLQQEAYDQAYMQGLEEGRKKGLEEYRQHIVHAQEVISSVKEDYHRHIEKAESVILELGMRTAERVIGRILDNDPSVFLDLVKRGIKEVREHPEVQIHIHPEKYPLLTDSLEELESMFPVLQKLLIFPDDELGSEECFIETREGRVIVSVDSQLREIKSKLVEILEGEKG